MTLQTWLFQGHPHSVCKCCVQYWTLFRTQVQSSHPKASLACQTKCAFYRNLSSSPLSLSLLHSTMVVMAQSVLSGMMLPWLSHWTLQGSFIWHCHILLLVASHPVERGVTMPCALLFSFDGSEYDRQKLVAKIYAQLLPLQDTLVANNVSL